MKNKNEFYIGWQNEMPAKTKSFLRKYVIIIAIVVAGLAVLAVSQQKPYNDYVFEFGNVKNITGTYYNYPMPLLIADDGMLEEGLSNSILLIGLGKHGAEETMAKIQEKVGSLDGKKVTLSGSLIYGNGKTAMELTLMEESLVKIESKTVNKQKEPIASNEIQLTGEILDSKCYFGVMKPAVGKVHKSCAIRCISGGMPPVFKTSDESKYYLILDQDGNKMNEQLLPYIAEQLAVNGKTATFMGWDILYLNLKGLPYESYKLSELCSKQTLTNISITYEK
ncbi:MAG: hypothetical protein AAFO07_17095 [Bacteroidota bacterium]